MKTQTIEVYKCEYCNKLYQRKHHCENHEERCTKRPDYLRPCHSCQILKKIKAVIWSGVGDFYGVEMERTVDVLFCEKIDCFIYPPSVEVKGNSFDMGQKLNIVMPKECKHHFNEA